MPKRIVNETVVVRRNGKRHVPTIGKPFSFSNQEIEEIVGTADAPVRPQALSSVYATDDDDDDDLEIEEGRAGPAATGDHGKDPALKPDPKNVGQKAPGAVKGKPQAPDADDDL